MANKNYDELVNKFFDEFEANVGKNLKTQRKLMLGTVILIVAFLALATLSEASGIEFLAVISMACMFAIPIFVIIRRILKKKSKMKIKEQEGKFFDEVYMQIIAQELDAEVNSVSYVNKDFKKVNAQVGETVEKRTVELAGFYNGCPYKITQGNIKVVDSIVYHKVTGAVLTYVPRIIEGHFSCDYRVRHATDTPISITSPMLRGGLGANTLKTVRMDNKNFKFEVGCDDAVAAYKFLTVDVMDNITALDKQTKVNSMYVTSDSMLIETNENLINLYYTPSFSKNLQKNRANYNADEVLAKANESIDKIRSFFEKSPAASFVVSK